MLRRGLWEDWPCMGFLLIISLIIVGIILGVEKSQQNSTTIRHKRAQKEDACVQYYRGIELEYTNGSTSSFTFDLCSVINCRGLNSSWRGYDVYLCDNTGTDTACGCKHASELFPGKKDRVTMYITLGVDQNGKDSMGLIKINVVPKPQPNITETKNVSVISMVDKHVGVDYTKLTPEDIIEKATGYGETNLWLEWLINTAKEQKIDDCVACAGARPRLHIEPAPLHPNDTWGYNCMLSLTREVGSTNCTTLASIFPQFQMILGQAHSYLDRIISHVLISHRLVHRLITDALMKSGVMS